MDAEVDALKIAKDTRAMMQERIAALESSNDPNKDKKIAWMTEILLLCQQFINERNH